MPSSATLSRGASHVTFVDTGAESRGLIRDHIEAFGAGGIAKLLRRDATALGCTAKAVENRLTLNDWPVAFGEAGKR